MGRSRAPDAATELGVERETGRVACWTPYVAAVTIRPLAAPTLAHLTRPSTPIDVVALVAPSAPAELAAAIALAPRPSPVKVRCSVSDGGASRMPARISLVSRSWSGGSESVIVRLLRSGGELEGGQAGLKSPRARGAVERRPCRPRSRGPRRSEASFAVRFREART